MVITGKGETQWETRAVRKTRKRDRNRTPKNRNKKTITNLISSLKENLDRNHGTAIKSIIERKYRPKRRIL
jgi:hypothetical protein